MGYFARIEHAREGLFELTDEFLTLKKEIGHNHPVIAEGLKKIGEFHVFLDDLYYYHYRNDCDPPELFRVEPEDPTDWSSVNEEVEPFFHNNKES